MAESAEDMKSMVEEDDLEDGEIEDDDENVEVTPAPPPAPKVEEKRKKSPEKKPSESSKKSSSASSSRKDRSMHDDDDFMSNIESQIASVLKEKGVEPPMPSIKRPDPESEPEVKTTSTSKSARKRRRRQETKERRNRERDRESSSSKKRSKLNDDDGLYMVGGSPGHSNHSESEESSYSSYDSDDYHRTSHDDRRNRRRDKYSSRSERERQRDRDHKDRRKDRERDRERDNEKEVCLRFAEFGHCPDDECTKSHEVRQPKKMELCKFWLMECCAKKDKCSYMHGDFPCKFYYLGLKCVNKDCKFMHGKPLSDSLKNILLKHLDTAPKEILGDFPRIGRENASKMIATTHIKLCEEFNVPIPESEKASGNSKIPSLMDMKLKPPGIFQDSQKESSSRSSRWINRDKDSPAKQSSPTSSSALAGPGDALLSDMKGILSEKQIESMAAVGVKTVNHINNLTVAQLNDIGLSLATIGEIQATAINMHNKMSASTSQKESESSPKSLSEDVDMRVFPKDSAIKSPDTIMSPTQSDAEVQEIYKKPADVPQQNANLLSPPVDYSQYLRDSNINTDNDEDEPSLKIDETYGSDYEAEEKKDSQSEDDNQASESGSIPLLPPSIIDTSAFLKATPAKVDISSTVEKKIEKESPTQSRDPRSRDPRMSSQAKSTEVPQISSPTYRDPRQQTTPETTRRTSIYEIESPSEDEDVQIKLSKDKDMRMPFSENGDVDFRFPFTPMTNYVPATEIEASYGTYNFEKYEVKIVDIPRPDYSDIRRSFRQTEHTQDPRLKKLCGIKSDSDKEELANITLPSDPRKRKAVETKTETAPSGPKRLQISTILQNSKHYAELSSSQKMIVNDVLSELSKQLKLFHADQSPSKVFDTSFISSNPRLQQILIGLGVFVNAEGEFEEIKEFTPTATPQVVTLPPNIHQMPPPAIVPNIFNQPPPANLMLQPPPNFMQTPPSLVRPGILGVAPNMGSLPFFDAASMSQPPPFANDQMNFNRNQQQSGSSNNYRNNSHRNNSGNNNYRNNRR